MSNNQIIFLTSIINLYKERIEFYLSENLNEQIIQTLANILALHYNTENTNINHTESANICCIKLKKYLNYRVITETDFTIALELFAIAIAEDFNDEQDLLSSQKQAIINRITAELWEDAASDDFLDFIEFLLTHKDSNKIINYISSNKKRATEIISKSLKANSSIKKTDLYNELGNLFSEEAKNAKPSIFGSVTKTAYSVVLSIGIIYASISALSIMAPIGLLPIAFMSFKTLSKQADSISHHLKTQTDKLLEHNDDIPEKIQKVTELARTQNTRMIDPSVLKEASNILEKLGPLQDANIKVKKEHTKEVISQAEAIKKKIDSRQY